MSHELIAIIVFGLLLGTAELVRFRWALGVLREIPRLRSAVAGLVVQESEKIQQPDARCQSVAENHSRVQMQSPLLHGEAVS
jgi:hypothetical protein